jgi:uncharacterized damage-inducible protein DinB
VAIKDALLPEFDHETGTTRRLLERVPEDKLTWKPHEKSMTLGRLAMHIAEMPGWGTMAVTQTEIDFSPAAYKPRIPESRQEILATFEEAVTKCRQALEHVSDAELMATWTMKNDGKPVFSAPRAAVLRSFVMNHMIHHRGQLSVYLRENDVPVPSIYGPSADERG